MSNFRKRYDSNNTKYVGLGFLQDSINIVKNAVTYLEERGSYGS